MLLDVISGRISQQYLRSSHSAASSTDRTSAHDRLKRWRRSARCLLSEMICSDYSEFKGSGAVLFNHVLPWRHELLDNVGYGKC
jgi:hypothetical protein